MSAINFSALNMYIICIVAWYISTMVPRMKFPSNHLEASKMNLWRLDGQVLRMKPRSLVFLLMLFCMEHFVKKKQSEEKLQCAPKYIRNKNCFKQWQNIQANTWIVLNRHDILETVWSLEFAQTCFAMSMLCREECGWIAMIKGFF